MSSQSIVGLGGGLFNAAYDLTGAVNTLIKNNAPPLEVAANVISGANAALNLAADFADLIGRSGLSSVLEASKRGQRHFDFSAPLIH